ncbi:hypothetical protein NE865_14594 [Phthorimaea operculella]|nr:hypothetical protein NE865_14594 [Phthorimaea operculella]
MEEELNKLREQMRLQQEAIKRLTEESRHPIAAGISTPPPQQFSFKGSEWTAWITRFEQYREATKLKHMSAETQVNSLLYLMGSKANDIISSLKLTKDEMRSYDTVKAKFESYYITKKTKMYARAQFNQRVQKEDETADDFITDLHKLGKKCEYGSLEDELVRDRIVAGMKNHELSKQIQNKQEEPTLQNVINRVRHAEVVEAGMGLLNQKAHGSTETEVHQIQKKWNKPKYYDNDEGPCRKCGKTPKHRFAECGAANSTCKTCGIKGHWMTVCRYNKSKKEGRAPRNVHQVETWDDEDEIFFGTTYR